MGMLLSKISISLSTCSNVGNVLTNVRPKRKRDQIIQHDSCEEPEAAAPPAKKKRLMTTTKYIYQMLFKEQKHSDITIIALDRVWKLHKVYLSQSLYFRSMFGGAWKESKQKCIHVTIPDKRIKPEALDAVFGSLYSDEIEIPVELVTSIMAAAAMFQIECIIDRCVEVMMENMNEHNVVEYWETGLQYGSLQIEQEAFKWLKVNLLTVYVKNPKLLRSISIDLMVQLVSCPSLYVMQTEFSLYTMLKIWIYLQLFPDYEQQDNDQLPLANSEQIQLDSNGLQNANGNMKHTNNTANDPKNDPIQLYFSQRKNSNRYRNNSMRNTDDYHPNDTDRINSGGDGDHGNTSNCCSFIESDEGHCYWPVFQALRTQYLITHEVDLQVVLKDNILPSKWFNHHVLHHWTSVLKIDHCTIDNSMLNIDAAAFNANCLRFGRVLNASGYHKWRWTGFLFGLDLVLVADNKMFSIRRMHRTDQERLLSSQNTRHILARLSIAEINERRHPTCVHESEIKLLKMGKNTDDKMLELEGEITYPLLISLNMLLIPPDSQDFKRYDPIVYNGGRIGSMSDLCLEMMENVSTAASNRTNDENGQSPPADLSLELCSNQTLVTELSQQDDRRSVSIYSIDEQEGSVENESNVQTDGDDGDDDDEEDGNDEDDDNDEEVNNNNQLEDSTEHNQQYSLSREQYYRTRLEMGRDTPLFRDPVPARIDAASTAPIMADDSAVEENNGDPL